MSGWPRSEKSTQESKKKAAKGKSRTARAGAAVRGVAAAAVRVPGKVVRGTVSLATAPFRGKPKESTATAALGRQPNSRGTHFDRY